MQIDEKQLLAMIYKTIKPHVKLSVKKNRTDPNYHLEIIGELRFNHIQAYNSGIDMDYYQEEMAQELSYALLYRLKENMEGENDEREICK